jgi:D-alanine-D-alanine ligase
MGGLSNEREISLKTGAAVLASLLRQGVDAVGIDAGRDLAERLREARPDLAYVALHGAYGEDGCAQGMLEVMGIPYTGSGVTASAVAMDKHLTKIVCRQMGIRTPDWSVVSRARFATGTPEGLTAPAAVKPVAGGSSLGVTLTNDTAAIPAALERALAEDGRAMVERLIDGRLLTVGVVGGSALPVIEIAVADGYYDFAHKYTPGATIYSCPAPIDDAVKGAAQAMVVALHEALGCRGVTRTELILDADGRLWLLEINTIPGMTETSLIPKAAAAAGMSFDDVVALTVAEALGHGR